MPCGCRMQTRDVRQEWKRWRRAFRCELGKEIRVRDNCREEERDVWGEEESYLKRVEHGRERNGR